MISDSIAGHGTGNSVSGVNRIAVYFTPEERRARVQCRSRTKRNRFAVYESGETAYLSYHVLEDGTLEFAYTYTPLAIRGRGIATAVIKNALDHARSEGKKVEPTCPFVATYIDRHCDYQEISTHH